MPQVGRQVLRLLFVGYLVRMLTREWSNAVNPDPAISTYLDETNKLVLTGEDHSNGAAICACIRNEGRYLDEWLDYHESIGFNEFHINDNSPRGESQKWNGTRGEGEQSSSDVFIYATPNHNGAINIKFNKTVAHPEWQFYQYSACVAHLKRTSRVKYVAFLDIDEFLVLYEHKTVSEYLEETLGDTGGAIQVHWIMMGTAHHAKDIPHIPVSLRFQQRERGLDFATKMLGRVRDIREMFVHTGRMMRRKIPIHTYGTGPDERLRYSCCVYNVHEPVPAAVYHYYTKSLDEFSRRMFCKTHKNCITKQRKGRRLFEGDIHDDVVWQTLTKNLPHYKVKEKDYQAALAAIYGSTENQTLFYERAKSKMLSPSDG